MPKLTENQIYCVKCRDRVTLNKSDVRLKKMSNGSPYIKCSCPKCESPCAKIISASDTKKYTNCK